MIRDKGGVGGIDYLYNIYLCYNPIKNSG